VIDTRAWAVPPLFRLIAERGQVARAEMHRVFNLGVGYLLVIDPAERARLEAAGLPDLLGVIGEIAAGAGPVELAG